MQVETDHAGGSGWIDRRGVAETLACAIAFLTFVPSLGFQFVYDDTPQIIQNPAVQAWRNLPHYFTSHAWANLYPHVNGNYYRPLFLLWLRLNDAVFGLEPKGWHLTAVLCHVAATYLVFALVRRLADDRGIAFSAATLFALHPVHIESVAWVSGVTDPLMAIFLMGSFLAYWRFRQEQRWSWMSLALALFALGLLEKETAIVLAPLVFVYAWLYAEGSVGASRWAFALRQSWPFFAVTVLYLGVREQALRGLSHPVSSVSWSNMALTEPSILWLYFRHLLIPSGLSGFYGLPYVDNPASAAFVVPTLLLLGLAMVLAWSLRRWGDTRLALFACWWMVLPIIPALWLRAYRQGDIAHDRYLYLPSIGFVLLVSLALAKAAGHWRAHHKTLQFAALTALALAYACGTVTQQFYWASDLILFDRAYRTAPQDNLICNDLGTALMNAGKSGDAMALYAQVLARDPGYWLSNYNLGYAYYKLGKFPEAEIYLRRAISIDATDSDENIYLGLSLWRQGRTDEAAQYIERAIQIRPSAPGYHFALAIIRRDQNNIPGAESEFNLELQYHPESAAARQQLEALASGAAAGSKQRNAK